MSNFYGYGVQVELKDGKLIQGKIAKATTKGLTLSDVRFGDGGTSQAFKVRASRLKDLKVLSVSSESNSKKNNRPQSRQQQRQPQQQQQQSNTDWQNDDIAKIKNQEDFDFQGSSLMFNKKDVFAQLKQQDEISPESRLVSHNKKQGNVNEKYDIDELVIPDAKNDAWNRLSGENNLDDEEDDYEIDDVDNPNYFPITKSINITHLLHSASSSSNKTGDNESSSSGDGQDELLTKLGQMIIDQSSRGGSISAATPNIMKHQSLKGKDINIIVPLATPVQLLEIERVNSDLFGISAPIVLENFALNTSFFIRQKLGGRTRLNSQNTNAEPLIVILTSDTNRAGTRAMALGRHLGQTNHIRVIALFTSNVNELQDAQVKEQLELFKKCGGKIVNSVSALESTVKKLNSPVEMVIDAMQGFDCNITDLYEDDPTSEESTLEMIEWSNEQQKLNKQVWSLNIPSGFDSGSGMQDSDVAVKATGIISTGWPLMSLHMVKQNMASLEDVVVVYMGTPQSVYQQKTSLRKFQSCDLFVTEGSLSLQF